MAKAIWRREGAGEGTVFAAIATILDFIGDVGVDGIADCEVHDVPGSDPGDHEDAKDNIAEGCEAEVFEAFGYLQDFVRRSFD